MEENKNLKEEISKSLNSLNEVKSCFAIFSDGKRNNVYVGGYGLDIINIIANTFLESPELFDLLKPALELVAERKQNELICKMFGDKKEECPKETSKNEELEEMMKKFLGAMSQMLKN